MYTAFNGSSRWGDSVVAGAEVESTQVQSSHVSGNPCMVLPWSLADLHDIDGPMHEPEHTQYTVFGVCIVDAPAGHPSPVAVLIAIHERITTARKWNACVM